LIEIDYYYLEKVVFFCILEIEWQLNWWD